MGVDASLAMPKHVVIIPDGNRRWAKERGLESWQGHEAGAENTEHLVRKARSLGIHSLSFWGSSKDNLAKRPLPETRALLRIYETYFTKLVKSPDIHEDQARINFIGDWERQFPEPLKKILYRCRDTTKQYSRYLLNFFLAYNGDDEMLEAVRKIAASGLKPEHITGETIKQHLMTKDLPPVDYLIRTGGEPHLSVGFMMWDVANAQLFFSDKHYPDFNAEAFEEALVEYQQRGRRYGQ